MQECARELGGRGAVTARAGGGTRVHALLPVARQSDARSDMRVWHAA
ncbi:hypothetical protein [Streptosporangium minutum]|nr:hypothetical protein [Streptosporangium minutum]